MDGSKQLEYLVKHVENRWGLKATIEELYGEKDLNFKVKTADGSFILKLHLTDTNQLEDLESQNSILKFLTRSERDFQLPEIIPTTNHHDHSEIKFKDKLYYSRLLSWVDGELYSSISNSTEALLENIGEKNGQLLYDLQSYDSEIPSGSGLWIPSDGTWAKEKLDIFGDQQRSIASYFLTLLESHGEEISNCRKGMLYMDANDNNILISNNTVAGFIDFGDSSYAPLVNEPAVALSYLMMNSRDPLRNGMAYLRGFQRSFQLNENEISLLYTLIGSRLILSVTHSAARKVDQPENEYLQVSDKAAWELLEKWRSISPAKAEAYFREASGFEPVPNAKAIRETLEQTAFYPIMGNDLMEHGYSSLDLSVGSTEIGNVSEFKDIGYFEKHVETRIENEKVGFLAGGYLENRMVYTTEMFSEMGNWGKEWRTVHLGHDYWATSGTPVYSPWEGEIHSAFDNEGESNYGPTIILKHRIDDSEFYTLYGHLDREHTLKWKKGDRVEAGTQLALLGQYKENGNWVPHLHFQVIIDLWGNDLDFQGVAFYHEHRIFASLCPDPALITGVSIENDSIDQELIDKTRKKHLGPNLSVSYRKPLYIQRGYKQFLYDHTGRRYLDTVNNVAHVGHQHPEVISALKRQASVLNTNTRYLHHEIVSYARELSALFPDPLEVCYFVNSGSEANELALRMAKTVTGQIGMLAMEMGYHGNTTACIDVSSYKFDRKGGRGKPESTTLLPIPDPYRRPELRKTYKQEIDHVFDQMQGTPAGIICESILSCAGQIVPPEGYYMHAAKKIRSLGGLFIADEVQVGFGRPGKALWGFELSGIVPDIVTMGKPIGNGHPLGAVITTREIAEAFSNGMEFFNTFGGNPVSCSVGRAVLRVLESEGLQENARDTGNYIMDSLRELQSNHPTIGDVRGSGLFLGFELSRDGSPATREASNLVNHMRDRAVLMSTDGPDENVIKIKPPMCITRQDADYMIEQLDKVLLDNN